ncbi:MAG TPA: tetratricopeptide repeat protein, partial [bacterium]
MLRSTRSFTRMGVMVVVLLFFAIGVASAVSPDEMSITTKSDEARKLFLKGRDLAERFHLDDARQILNEAIVKDPHFALAHLFLYYNSSSAMEAEQHLAEAAKSANSVSEAERLVIEAEQAFNKDNPVSGIAHLEKLVAMLPKDKRAQWTLGIHYGLREHNEKAVAQFQKVIALDKDFAPVYNSLGYTYVSLNDFEKAEEAFQNYVRLQPDEANPHDSLADLYTKMGKHEQAIEHYQQALKINPKFSWSQRKIGTNLVFLAQYEDGRTALRKAMAIESLPAERLRDMSLIVGSYLYEGKPADALAESEKIAEMAAKENLPEWIASCHLQECEIYRELNELEKAQASLEACRGVAEHSGLPDVAKTSIAQEILFQEGVLAVKRMDYQVA